MEKQRASSGTYRPATVYGKGFWDVGAGRNADVHSVLPCRKQAKMYMPLIFHHFKYK
jgi:hypothetical protein